MDEILPKNAILASNTSSISITKLAKFVKRPKQVIGMHFMNPVPVMTLVEVIKGLETSEETLDLTKKYVFYLFFRDFRVFYLILWVFCIVWQRK